MLADAGAVVALVWPDAEDDEDDDTGAAGGDCEAHPPAMTITPSTDAPNFQTVTAAAYPRS